MDAARDHLFISYAWEDSALAEWLTLRLTSEGYRVWCDRFKLLGGESYPKDIDIAIKERTFRLIALLSRHSLHKANPTKERTLALNISRERTVDFLIPLNVDGLTPTDLTWMLADLTFIPFDQSWARGLEALLKKLSAIGTPRPFGMGREAVTELFTAAFSANQEVERLWTNLLPLKAIPPILKRVHLEWPAPSELFNKWPLYRQNDKEIWLFELPDDTSALEIRGIEKFGVYEEESRKGPKPPHITSFLIGRHLKFYCLRMGLRETRWRQLYFPPDLAERVTFTGYDGRRTWILPSGERSFRTGIGSSEKVRYHLSPSFKPQLERYGDPFIELQLSLYLTTNAGDPLDPKKALRRRKRICKGWWNHQWLSRFLAVVSWLADGKEEIRLNLTQSCELIVAPSLLTVTSPIGIAESLLAPPEQSSEDEIIDDEDDASLSPEELEEFGESSR